MRLFFLGVFISLFALTAHSQTTTELQERLAAVFNDFDDADKPGAAVAILQGGKVVFKNGYGSANLEYDFPVRTNTPFHVASVAKQFTAFSILLLEAEGKLSLQDDIRKYIPELPDFGHKITLYHLLTHTSGLRDQWNLFLLKGVRPDDVITTRQVLTMMSQQRELNFAPGEEYLYCNTGYTLLAETVSRVSGLSFAAFTRQRIFKPLGMKQSVFVDDHELIIPGRAQSYYSPDGQTFKKRVLNYANPGPTNLVTTVEDLSQWVLNFQQHKVGGEALFEKLQTPARLNNGKTFGGALGLFVGNYNGHKEVGHGGADAGFRVQISMFPEEDFAVIVLGNSAEFDAEGIAHSLTDLYLKPAEKDTKESTERKFIALSKKQLRAYEGNYVNHNRGFTRHIYLKGDSLMHFRTENNESALAPLSANTFKVMNVPPDVIVAFELKDGVMTATETVNGGEPRPLEKFDPKPYTDNDWLNLEGTYYSPELSTHYSLTYKDGKLSAHHQRMGTIHLEKVKHDFFLGDRGFFGQVDLVRDEQGKVTGLKVSNGRVRNLVFEKR
ncbi:MAG: hypothetical protein Roseis2KO_48730 [Roseivirga sp.]